MSFTKGYLHRCNGTCTSVYLSEHRGIAAKYVKKCQFRRAHIGFPQRSSFVLKSGKKSANDLTTRRLLTTL